MNIIRTEHHQEDIDTIFAGGRNTYLHKDFIVDSYSCTFYDFELVTRGKFQLHVNNNVIEVQSGDLYIVPPHVVRKKVILEEGSSTSYLAVQLPELKRYMINLISSDILYVCRPSDKCIKYLEDTIDTLERYRTFEAYQDGSEKGRYRKGKMWSDRIPNEAGLRQSGMFYLFISQLLHDHGKQSKNDVSQLNKDEYVMKAIKFIKANFKDNISVDSVAQNIGLHRSYLYSLFQQYAGISVCDYIIQVRIEAACELLRQGNIPIKVVALSVGYSPITFARTFKKQMGITATEYQKKYAKNQEDTDEPILT